MKDQQAQTLASESARLKDVRRQKIARFKQDVRNIWHDLVEQTKLQSQLTLARDVLKMAAEASHESGCLGAYNNNSCDCIVSEARAALEKLNAK